MKKDQCNKVVDISCWKADRSDCQACFHCLAWLQPIFYRAGSESKDRGGAESTVFVIHVSDYPQWRPTWNKSQSVSEKPVLRREMGIGGVGRRHYILSEKNHMFNKDFENQLKWEYTLSIIGQNWDERRESICLSNTEEMFFIWKMILEPLLLFWNPAQALVRWWPFIYCILQKTIYSWIQYFDLKGKN